MEGNYSIGSETIKESTSCRQTIRVKTRNRWLLIVASTFVIVSCMACFQIVVNRCWWWDCAPERSFELSDLNLPPQFFPEDATTKRLHPLSENDGALEAVGATIYWNSQEGLAVYTIWKFATEQQANRRYEHYLDRFFYRNSPTPLTQNPEITYHSEIAEEYYVACGIVETGTKWTTYRCQLNAQYKEIFISFNAIIDDEMTVHDFQEIIIFIDQKIESLLY